VHCAGVQKTLPLKVVKRKPISMKFFNVNVKVHSFLAKVLVKKGRFNPQGSSCFS